MGGYLANFSVYTFAMIGFLFVAVAIYKKTNVAAATTKQDGEMAIENSLSLSPRKRLHVVRVNGEKFLIAADVERTEFLAKLDNNEVPVLKDNLISINKHPKLTTSTEGKIASLLSKKAEQLQTQGNVALQSNAIKETRLSQIKNSNLKKPPMMKEILRKLEAPQG